MTRARSPKPRSTRCWTSGSAAVVSMVRTGKRLSLAGSGLVAHWVRGGTAHLYWILSNVSVMFGPTGAYFEMAQVCRHKSYSKATC